MSRAIDEPRLSNGVTQVALENIEKEVSRQPPGVFGFVVPWAADDLEYARLSEQGGTARLEVHKLHDATVGLVVYRRRGESDLTVGGEAIAAIQSTVDFGEPVFVKLSSFAHIEDFSSGDDYFLRLVAKL